MIQKFDIGNLHCSCNLTAEKTKVAYILYPMDILDQWIESAAKKYRTNIIVITGMDWQNVFSPWPAPGVPKGSPDFKGESPEFLRQLQQTVIPYIEETLALSADVERSLIGVSMSGLFALWQWMECDTFENIASLSGSFWYEGFLEWIKSLPIPEKTGKAYFLLGDKESQSKVKTFNTVALNTDEIVLLLQQAGINICFDSVPGDHYSDPIPRLDKAFTALYTTPVKHS